MEMPTHGNCNNMILAAPSGSGKTETYRAFKDYFKKRIPALRLTISDVSNLTATGYRGAEPSSIVEPFLGADWNQSVSCSWTSSTRSALHHTALIMEMSTLRCSIICLRWLRDRVLRPNRNTSTRISCCSLAWGLLTSSEKREKTRARSRLDLEQVEVMKLWNLNMRLRSPERT